MAARMKDRYLNEITPALMQKFNYTTVMQVPKVEKVVINMGVGEAVSNSKVLDTAVEDLQKISGQKPVVTKAKKSIAGFKLRENMPIGAKVTFRGERMYHFLDKFSTYHFHVYVISVVFPTKLLMAVETTHLV